jgi:hypothetical protein
LGVEFVGFIYTAATSLYAVWYDQGVIGVVCLVVAIVLFRIWNSAMDKAAKK